MLKYKQNQNKLIEQKNYLYIHSIINSLILLEWQVIFFQLMHLIVNISVAE